MLDRHLPERWVRWIRLYALHDSRPRKRRLPELLGRRSHVVWVNVEASGDLPGPPWLRYALQVGCGHGIRAKLLGDAVQSGIELAGTNWWALEER